MMPLTSQKSDGLDGDGAVLMSRTIAADRSVRSSSRSATLRPRRLRSRQTPDGDCEDIIALSSWQCRRAVQEVSPPCFGAIAPQAADQPWTRPKPRVGGDRTDAGDARMS